VRARPAARFTLPPVEVDERREIRTVVGLRPFRPAGFVVRGERLGDKLVVHNYGHGGGGVTLSWGTADLAAQIVRAAGVTRAAVLGCGAVGLATARLLLARGVAVTLYAAELPPDTTSNIAGAQCFPFTVFERGALTPEFREQLVAAARFAYHRWQSLVGARWGVRWMVNYHLGDAAPPPASLLGDDSPVRFMLADLADFGPGEHPFPRRFVRRFATLMIEPATYLPALVDDVRLAGAAIVVRRFAALPEVLALPEPAIVNCTGLGAAALFGDEALVPVKGQLHVLLPQREVDYAVLAGDLYMFARQDGVLLGGTHERGVFTLEPNLEARRRIYDGHARLFGRAAI
jgi:glycine/D-amino acid oxidase-like deaminating enzyme